LSGISNARRGVGSSWRRDATQAETLLQQHSQARAGPVEARLRISDRPIQHFCDFVVFVALYVMENDNQLLEWRQGLYRALEIEAVKRASQEQVGSGECLADGRTIAFSLLVFLK